MRRRPVGMTSNSTGGDTVTELAMLAGLLGASVVSSLVPIVNAEALLLGSVIAAPPELALVIVSVVAFGQVAGKLVLYAGGAGLDSAARKRRADGRVARLTQKLGDRPMMLRATLLGSSYAGLPPLYAMALVCGAVRMPRGSFVGLCLAGRFGRFYTLALVPGWVI